MTTETPNAPTIDAEARFADALAAFQAAVPHIGKDQTADTGSYKYSYADLSDITHAALPLLAEHGLSWSAKTMVTPAGFLLLSSLRHVAGWTETCEWPLPDPTRSSAQQVGSALTYGRRYTFTALTGIAPGGEDDDAQQTGRTAADTPAPSPLVAAKNAVWEQAQRLGWTKEVLIEKYAEDNGGQVIDSAAPADLHAYAKKLKATGANGLPLNKDGSVSKSQITEEQRTEAGIATKAEAKAHKDLTTDVLSDDKLAERTGPVDPADDPWASIPVATPGGEAA